MPIVKEVLFTGDVVDTDGNVRFWADITGVDEEELRSPRSIELVDSATAGEQLPEVEQFSEQARAYIAQIEQGIEISTRGGYRHLKVDGVSIEQFLAVRLKGISADERVRIQDRYMESGASKPLGTRALAATVNAPRAIQSTEPQGRSWETADWAQRAAHDY